MTDIFRKHKVKTKFTTLELRQTNSLFELCINDQVIHSNLDVNQPGKLLLKNLRYLMGAQLFISAPKRILLLGTGGGALIHFIQHHYPASHVTSVDIDGELVEFLQSHMHLPPDSPKLTHVIEDAQTFLGRDQNQYDLILVDIFSGFQSPQWLLTASQLKIIKDRLASGAAIAFNLLINSEHQFKNFYRDLRRTFNQKTLCLSVEGLENTLVFAMRDPVFGMQIPELQIKAEVLKQQQEIEFPEILSNMLTTNPIGCGII
ncbi:MAG: spermidine synthase [Gammaproteobacteria bacterium]|jgi:spermidine synthase